MRWTKMLQEKTYLATAAAIPAATISAFLLSISSFSSLARSYLIIRINFLKYAQQSRWLSRCDLQLNLWRCVAAYCDKHRYATENRRVLTMNSSTAASSWFNWFVLFLYCVSAFAPWKHVSVKNKVRRPSSLTPQAAPVQKRNARYTLALYNDLSEFQWPCIEWSLRVHHARLLLLVHRHVFHLWEASIDIC